jgi:hypothetical protein
MNLEQAMAEQDGNKGTLTRSASEDDTNFSNAIRLTGRQWLFVGLFTALLFCAPTIWKHEEPFTLEPDYRMPHDLSHDYWLYERFAGLAVTQNHTLLLGDSVVWGDYVLGKDTLSHYLNEYSGQEGYANLGLHGAHPLALAGLIEHYAGSIRSKNVVLQFNPLWLTSPRLDLQDDSQTDFYHPRLVPQFVPKIPSYKEEISPRIGVVVEQHLPLNSWTTHLQQAYYDRTDIPSWTVQHPYDNPLAPLARCLPPADQALRHAPVPWDKSKTKISKEDYPWVDLETSLQWQAFQRAIKILQDRGNRVFILVGPFNEHLLLPESLKRYRALKAAIEAWLLVQDFPHLMAATLPSDQYGDASHSLAAGYAQLARQLWAKPSFRSFKTR